MSELLTGTWAIQPDYFRQLAALTARGVKSEGLTSERGLQRTGAVAVLPVHGVISQRGHAALSLFGIAQTSTERLVAQIRKLADNPTIDTIVLDIDSPGGSVGGITEAAHAIYGLRSKKPIIAISNSLAASAAYWLGSAASEFYVTPSSETGSIGVFTTHHDISRALDRQGETVTLIHAGQYKVEGNFYEPLGSEAHQYIQETVDSYYAMFLGDVEQFRGSDLIGSTDAGQGRTVGASQAVADGLADGIATLDEIIGGNVTQQRREPMAESTGSKDDARWNALTAEERKEFNDDKKAWEAYQRANAAGLVRQTKAKPGVWKHRQAVVK